MTSFHPPHHNRTPSPSKLCPDAQSFTPSLRPSTPALPSQRSSRARCAAELSPRYNRLPDSTDPTTLGSSRWATNSGSIGASTGISTLDLPESTGTPAVEKLDFSDDPVLGASVRRGWGVVTEIADDLSSSRPNGQPEKRQPIMAETQTSPRHLRPSPPWSPAQMPPAVYTALAPSGRYSLHAIALTTSALTASFLLSLIAALYYYSTYTLSPTYSILVAAHQLPAWRATVFRPLGFVGMLSAFHLAEYLATSRWNARYADRDAFLLLGNGRLYWVAMGAGLVEGLVHALLPRLSLHALLSRPLNALLHYVLQHAPSRFARYTPADYLTAFGLALVLITQALRTLAIREGGPSFTHRVATRKEKRHTLVRSGVYRVLRHPAYAAFFWWAVGTQVFLGNVVGLLTYAGVLWVFFRERIGDEEAILVKEEFFGKEYRIYREGTWSGIPGIR